MHNSIQLKPELTIKNWCSFFFFKANVCSLGLFLTATTQTPAKPPSMPMCIHKHTLKDIGGMPPKHFNTKFLTVLLSKDIIYVAH